MRLFGLELTLSRARIRQTLVAGSADIPENEHKWRSIRDGKRALPGFQIDRSLDISVKLLREDGIAGRMAEWLDEWCVGDGATITSNLEDQSEREEHEEFLYDLWDAPECRWETLQHDVAMTLRPVGELLFAYYPPKVRPGVATLAPVDAGNIADVVLNPKNPLQIVGVLLKTASGETPLFLPHHAWRRWAAENASAARATGFPDIPPEGGALSVKSSDGTSTWKVGPVCAYFTFKRLLGTSRGQSWYYPIADLLDAFDQSVWQQMEGVSARNTLATLVSATSGIMEKVVDALKGALGKGGVVLGIPKGAEVTTVGGGLGAGEYDVHHGTLCKRLSATTGFPITWFGLGTDAGNASTTELAGPAMKMLRKAQAEIRDVYREFLDFAIREGAPKDKVEAWLDYTLSLPEIGGRDMVRDATAFSGLSAAISDGTTEGAWTEAKGGEMRRDLASQFLGVEFDPEDYPDEAALEAKREAAKAPPTSAEDDEDPEASDAQKQAEDMARMKGEGRKTRQSRRRHRRPAAAGA